MQPWQLMLLNAGAAVILAGLLVRRAIRRYRSNADRDFTRKLETALQKGEKVELVCPQRGGNVVFTGKRLLFDTREGFVSLPLSRIRRIQGMTPEGKTTVSPPRMAKAIVKAEREYVLQNTGEEFVRLVKRLKEKT